ncbi:GNAT family N-acetyltransferase [Pseudotabrizicola sediminis]|uniref:GNAT family N-acetyltransferase n=1 Tax=Pseudotabrizicola sediminis TaxID=2486418 RepID=A0ABY2KQH0_9RHOB|nr:GNAT family N-acetyltransferase [Pseudotabrizicola sediminis]TGD44355.1 GNAT family N-acetyltransferase [Pseudotabrizicola sediminis]
MIPNHASIDIRPLGAAHLPEVHRMLIDLAAHHGDVATITPQVLRGLVLDAPDVRGLVAFPADRPSRLPVGYALLARRSDLITGRSGYDIAHLFVQDVFRGQGIGRALIAAARDLALLERCTRLTIGTHPANAGAAAAYRAMGLTERPAPGPSFAVALV